MNAKQRRVGKVQPLATSIATANAGALVPPSAPAFSAFSASTAKPWGVQKKKDADPIDASRHAAALEYFYANVTAVDAFDKNIRGTRCLLQRNSTFAATLLIKPL